jgi:Domain of unknown function (DUF5710)/T5orf172 domain
MNDQRVIGKEGEEVVARDWNDEKVYLHVPYEHKEKVKRLGGMWDQHERKWFINSGSEYAAQLVKEYGNTPTGTFIFPDSHRKLEGPTQGFVYCAVCDSQPGLVKVGYTARCVQQRMQELSNTSVATDFKAVFFIEVSDVEAAEAFLHDKLHQSNYKRINPKREFFRGTPDQVHNFFAVAEEMYPVESYLSVGVVLTAYERSALQEHLATIRSLTVS